MDVQALLFHKFRIPSGNPWVRKVPRNAEHYLHLFLAGTHHTIRGLSHHCSTLIHLWSTVLLQRFHHLIESRAELRSRILAGERCRHLHLIGFLALLQGTVLQRCSHRLIKATLLSTLWHIQAVTVLVLIESAAGAAHHLTSVQFYILFHTHLIY